MMDEDRLFDEAMEGVAPLRGRARVLGTKKPKGPAVQRRAPLPAHPMPEASGEMKKIGEMVVQAGVSIERVQKAARGQPPAEEEIDLHGLTRAQAIDLLCHRLASARQKGVRIVRIVHGRGLHSEGGRPVLREAIYQWFLSGQGAAFALAITPERRKGGGGASIVILRRKK